MIPNLMSVQVLATALNKAAACVSKDPVQTEADLAGGSIEGADLLALNLQVHIAAETPIHIREEAQSGRFMV